MLRRPSESRPMVHRSESRDHANPPRQGGKCRRPTQATSSPAVATQKMQKKRPAEENPPGLKMGRRANDVTAESSSLGFVSEVIENARAHAPRLFVESEYLNERAALLRDHNPPRISCNPIHA